jgi:NAD(P)-dependent dehydrogenase (short-subunit alcohol dehydrogenase family)
MNDLFSLAGKTALLTGASTGIGRHLAGVLSDAGARVVLGARSVDKLEERVAELSDSGGEAVALPLDVRDPDSISRYFDAAEAAFGPADILVNNAGVEAGVETYLTLAEHGWDNVLETNLKGLWLMSREFSSRTAAAGAQRSIINISSILAGRQQKGVFPYAVSKAGVNQATKIMALEGAKLGIRVNALAPGYIYTNVSKALLDSDQADDVVRSIPQRRFGEFNDLDGPLLLLASDASAHMTGSVVVVDGGHSVSSL